MHLVQLLKERKAKRTAIVSSKHWKKIATIRKDKIDKLHQQLNELKDKLAQSSDKGDGVPMHHDYNCDIAISG